jgi:hypothetical protein
VLDFIARFVEERFGLGENTVEKARNTSFF